MITYKKYENISWEIRKGLRCVSCKCKIEQDMDYLFSENEEIETCLSCKRDNSINSLIDKKKKYLLSFKKFMVSKKYNKMQIWLLGIMLGFVLVDVICLLVFKFSGFGYFSNIFNILFWVTMILNRRYTSIRKDKI
jgi:hypothetical protein